MSIWGQMMTPDAQQDRGGGISNAGTEFWEDFEGTFPEITQGASKNLGQNTYNAEAVYGQWSVWMGNNSGTKIGTAADTTNLPLEGGVLGLLGGTTAIDITLAAGCPGFRLISPATGFPYYPKLAFECSIAVSTLSSANLDLFVGLMDPGYSGTHITSAASQVFSATNTLNTTTGMGGCIGFWKRATTNPADVAVAYNVNNGTVQLPGSASNLQKLATNYTTSGATGLVALTTTNNIAAANTFIKLGFVFDPTPQRGPSLRAPAAITANQTAGGLYSPIVKFYVNGQQTSAFLNAADVQASTFPSSFLVPVIGYRSGGSAAGIGYVDWIRCAQYGSF